MDSKQIGTEQIGTEWLDERVSYFLPEAKTSIARLAEHNRALSDKASSLLELLARAHVEPQHWSDTYCKEAMRLWRSLLRSVDTRCKSIATQRKKLHQRKKPTYGFGREEIALIESMLNDLRPLLLSFHCLEFVKQLHELKQAAMRRELKLRSDQLEPFNALLARVERGVGAMLVKIQRVENMDLSTLPANLDAASRPTAYVNNEVAGRIKVLLKLVEFVREVLPPGEHNRSLEGAGIRVVPSNAEALGV